MPSARHCWRFPRERSTEGESPDQTAGRELAEETGYRAGRITPIRDWFVSPGVMTERMFLYLCEDLQPGPTDHQPDERLQTVILAWDDALAMAHDGRIKDAKSILALLICDRLRKAAPRSLTQRVRLDLLDLPVPWLSRKVNGYR